MVHAVASVTVMGDTRPWRETFFFFALTGVFEIQIVRVPLATQSVNGDALGMKSTTVRIVAQQWAFLGDIEVHVRPLISV